MKRIPRKIRLPKCRDNPDGSEEHDFITERTDRKAFAANTKREQWMWKHGWKRCWFCGVWIDWRKYMRTKKRRAKLMRLMGAEKFKRRDKKQNG